jgi:hypothetical protein
MLCVVVFCGDIANAISGTQPENADFPGCVGGGKVSVWPNRLSSSRVRRSVQVPRVPFSSAKGILINGGIADLEKAVCRVPWLN